MIIDNLDNYAINDNVGYLACELCYFSSYNNHNCSNAYIRKLRTDCRGIDNDSVLFLKVIAV